MKPIKRRQFVRLTAAAAVAWPAFSVSRALRAADSPGNRIVLGVMGTNGRGSDLIRGFLEAGGVEVAYVCDVDDRAIEKGIKSVGDKQEKPPKGVKDFRRILDDRSVDALVIGAPDHWHGPATILACAASKHVYVEKPASHNPREGELMIAASRKYKRAVQLGTQRRSMPGVVEGINKVRSGEIGRVLFSRGWYNNTRASIGRGKPAPVPAWLDWNLWQGPAPERPFRDNVVHYHWHWFWHWGTGELGNNGIHALDLCRWGLGVDYPVRVASGGGKYRYDDDQETPDTHTVTFDFGGKSIAWEGRSWHKRGFENSMFGAAFYGEKGTLVIDGGGYRIYDAKDVEIAKQGGSGSDRPHLHNFLEAIRSGKALNADIEEGHKSTLLCHLGNIAWRTGHSLKLRPSDGHILDDREANSFWSRDYQRGWDPKV